MSRTDAVEALYSDMAARHRARFRSIHVRHVPSLSAIRPVPLTQPQTDPQGRRAREGRRCQAPLHQAAPHQGHFLPPPPPRPQDPQPEDLLREAPYHFRINSLCGALFLWFSTNGGAGYYYYWQVFTRSHGTITFALLKAGGHTKWNEESQESIFEHGQNKWEMNKKS